MHSIKFFKILYFKNKMEMKNTESKLLKMYFKDEWDMGSNLPLPILLPADHDSKGWVRLKQGPGALSNLTCIAGAQAIVHCLLRCVSRKMD